MAPRLDRALTLSVVQPLIRLGAVRPTRGIPILMYHSVSTDFEPGVQPYYRLVTSPARFLEQMQWLKRNGFEVVSLTAAADCLKQMTTVDKHVVITFDDGLRDFLTSAWPILAQCGFTASVFLPTSFIGRVRQSFKGRECLTWSDVRTLRASGIDFGSHSVTHARLYDLNWRDLSQELVNSRATLEDELGESVRTFAYPYAFPQEDALFVSRFRQQLQAAGYQTGVTTVIGRAVFGDDLLCIPRIPINQCDDTEFLAAKVVGAYDWLAGVQWARRCLLARVHGNRRTPS